MSWKSGEKTAELSKAYTIRNASRNSVLAENAILADDSKTRRTGLLKRDSLPEGEGLIIAPCECVHTFGMRFPIDVIFVSKQRKVLKAVAALPRRRLAWSFRAEMAIELPAGTIERTGTVVGDEVSFKATLTEGDAAAP